MAAILAADVAGYNRFAHADFICAISPALSFLTLPISGPDRVSLHTLGRIIVCGESGEGMPASFAALKSYDSAIENTKARPPSHWSAWSSREGSRTRKG